MGDFKPIICIALNNWSALKLALSWNCGKEIQEKIEILLNSIRNRLVAGACAEELSEDFFDFMDSEFNFILEDNSDIELGELLTALYCHWTAGRSEEITAWLGTLKDNESILNCFVNPANISVSATKIESDRSCVETQPDPDGWTEVRRKK